jgi:DNA-directed RNA polymerase specialized sigma24 family protein
VLNDARRKKSAGERPAGDDLPAVAISDPEPGFVAEHLGLIADPRARLVVRLNVLEGWTLAEVASHLGLSVTRVHQLREQGLAAIRGRLEP